MNGRDRKGYATATAAMSVSLFNSFFVLVFFPVIFFLSPAQLRETTEKVLFNFIVLLNVGL